MEKTGQELRRQFAYRVDALINGKWIPEGFATTTPVSCYTLRAPEASVGYQFRIAVRDMEDATEAWNFHSDYDINKKLNLTLTSTHPMKVKK